MSRYGGHPGPNPRATFAEIRTVLTASPGKTSLLRWTPPLFSWKHFDYAFGPSIILVAETRGASSAYGRSGAGVWSRTTDKVGCVRTVDTATHPTFQGRGGRSMGAAFGGGSPQRRSAHRAGIFRPPGVSGLRLVANPLIDLEVDVFDLASWGLSLGDLELL